MFVLSIILVKVFLTVRHVDVHVVIFENISQMPYGGVGSNCIFLCRTIEKVPRGTPLNSICVYLLSVSQKSFTCMHWNACELSMTSTT